MITSISRYPVRFVKVDRFLMRSALPSAKELELLIKKEGLTDIINVSNNTPELALKQEEEAIKKFGLGYFKIPSKTNNPLQENIEKFLQIIIELKKRPGRKVLVHCNAGVDRTGTYVVFYQLFNKLKNINDAIKEMFEKGHNPIEAPMLVSRIRIIAKNMKLA